MVLKRKAFLQGRDTIPARDRHIPDRQRKSIPVATSSPKRGNRRSRVGCSVKSSRREDGSGKKIDRSNKHNGASTQSVNTLLFD